MNDILIYNEDKTQVLNKQDCNLELGYFENDFKIIHHDAIEYIEEKGHYETIAVYDNGGKDIKWIVDIEGQEAQEEYNEEVPILVYKRYSEEKLKEIENEKEIKIYQDLLNNTDYLAIKYSEGLFTEEEYFNTKVKREYYRDQIRYIKEENYVKRTKEQIEDDLDPNNLYHNFLIEEEEK